jgi:murein DD-endopeptidase MepM/ murein hydrolase activator NlpD
MNQHNNATIKNGESPVLSRTSFTRLFIEANNLDRNQLAAWVFHPGMLFGSPDKWWGDFGRRDFPHEGIDLCRYDDARKDTIALTNKSRIPVLYSGVVRAMFTDYLGQAVVVEHTPAHGPYEKMITVYAHTHPRGDIYIGKDVNAGDVIATVADTRRSKANIRPHLHLSIGIPAPDFAYDAFVWNIMRDPGLVTLLDPLSVIERPYHVRDANPQMPV